VCVKSPGWLSDFDRIASRYATKDAVPSSSLPGKNQLLLVLKPLLDESLSLDTIVGIGCGVGAPARYLLEQYERYIGIDRSEEMLKAAIVFNQDNPWAQSIASSAKSRNLLRESVSSCLAHWVLGP
jgi:SAM-dependent methyltransferase